MASVHFFNSPEPSDVSVPAPGAMCYFRGSGETHPSALTAALSAVGLDEIELPLETSAKVALHRAADTLKERRRLVRPLDGGGWTVVDEKLDAGVPVGYDEENKLFVRLVEDTPCVTPEDHPSRDAVIAEFQHFRSVWIARDINAWLTRTITSSYRATTLNDGHYFVPAVYLARLRALKAALASIGSNQIFILEAKSGEGTIEAILDAITREAEAEASAMERELDRPTNEENAGLGKRAIVNRFSALESLRGKLAFYEEMLDVKLETVRTRLETVRVNLTVAACALSEPDLEARR